LGLWLVVGNLSREGQKSLTSTIEMSAWRQAGLTYIHYSRICARVLRRSLKPDLRAEALKRDEGTIRAVFWKDGKAIQTKKQITIEEK